MIVGGYPIILLVSYAPVTFHGFGAREGLIVVMMGAYFPCNQEGVAIRPLLDLLIPALFGLVALRRNLGLQ